MFYSAEERGWKEGVRMRRQAMAWRRRKEVRRRPEGAGRRLGLDQRGHGEVLSCGDKDGGRPVNSSTRGTREEEDRVVVVRLPATRRSYEDGRVQRG